MSDYLVHMWLYFKDDDRRYDQEFVDRFDLTTQIDWWRFTLRNMTPTNFLNELDKKILDSMRDKIAADFGCNPLDVSDVEAFSSTHGPWNTGAGGQHESIEVPVRVVINRRGSQDWNFPRNDPDPRSMWVRCRWIITRV
ncbi:MAG: hypothetical protein KF841_02180 [Phycisphaerae bacterium]|nr:hypothetical protein [Phycisphaerae bacterium]